MTEAAVLGPIGNVWLAAAISLLAGAASVALLLRPRKPARRVRDVGPMPVPDATALTALPKAFDCCPACGCVELRESRVFRSMRFPGATPMECPHCGWEGRPVFLARDEYVAFVRSLP